MKFLVIDEYLNNSWVEEVTDLEALREQLFSKKFGEKSAPLPTRCA